MEKLRFTDVKEANRQGIKMAVTQGLDRLAIARLTYPEVILNVIESGNLSRQIDLASEETERNQRTASTSPLANSAGAYFINEDVIGGSRERDVLTYVNRFGEEVGMRPTSQKVKLGPGIGFIEAPGVYKALKLMGLRDQNLTINYTAPFGTIETRKGIKAIVDAKIDPEGDFFPDDGVFLTRGATEGIDLFMSAMSATRPGSRVVFLGLSYYAGPFSSFQKNLTVDRLITNPVRASKETTFLPTPEEIIASVSLDTSAIVLTMPNNPNGETYSLGELTKIITFAKERNIAILFDAIFENMYFDQKENYRSAVLQTAYELDALDTIVFVDSLSKTTNFPGERVGILATTNRSLINTLTDISLARICNPPLTLEPILQFEGLARKIKRIQMNSPTTRLSVIVDKVMGNGGNYPFDKNAMLRMYEGWSNWMDETLQFYRDNLQITKAIIDGSVNAGSPDKGAFNTLVRPSDIPLGTNNMDYLAKLMFTLATYTQVGPCFGLSQKIWDKNLGVWTRITYACSRDDLIEGLTRLIAFSQFYAEKNFGDPNKFPVLSIQYDNQI